MMYINTSGFHPSRYIKDSQVKLVQLKAQVTIGDKHSFIDTPNNKIWNDLKPYFERLSHKKCWFTEAYASVSDYSIEHFRPKKLIHLIRSFSAYREQRTISDAEGYWWLSYEISNLKLAGQKPNTFKKNYFPLETNSPIATSQNNIWYKEVPILLDPCVLDDTRLIRYDGITPKESNSNITSLEYIRANISIHVYALDRFHRLKTARSAVYAHVLNYYEVASMNWGYMNRYHGSNQDAFNTARDNYLKSCKYLINMLNPKEQFTKMVYDFLYGLNLVWVQRDIIDVAKQAKYIKW